MKPLEEHDRRARYRGLTRGAVLIAALTAFGAPVQAQQPKVPNPNAPRSLGNVQSERSKAQERIQELQAKDERLGREQERLRLRSIEIARKVQIREKTLTTSEHRLRQLRGEETGYLKELKERKTSLTSILAALQLMERNKPPALVVRPDDAVNAARTAMLLGSILPKLKDQADNLAKQLNSLVELRKGILDQREHLAKDREALEADRLRLSELIKKKKRMQLATRREVAQERTKLTRLANRAHDLESLVQNIDEYARARDKVAGPVPPGIGNALRPHSLTPGSGLNRRLQDFKGKLRPPVIGKIVRSFRQKDRIGRPSDGVIIRTRAGAQVVAPFDSTIMFAQPYKGYGQLLILSAGSGYYFVLAGMTKIYGVVGQKLLEGEPVGVMGASEEDVQVLDVPPGSGTGDALRASAGPDLYFEIRKNARSINPEPWLASARLERTTQ